MVRFGERIPAEEARELYRKKNKKADHSKIDNVGVIGSSVLAEESIGLNTHDSSLPLIPNPQGSERFSPEAGKSGNAFETGQSQEFNKGTDKGNPQTRADDGQNPVSAEVTSDGRRIKPQRKEPGFWTEERTREQAMAFCEQHGKLTSTLLREMGRFDLLYGISNYPGNLDKLRQDLGVQRGPYIWTEERTREQALTFYNQYGRLTSTLLREMGRFDLLYAIGNYADNLEKFRQDLGVPKRREPRRWTEERTIKETLAFYQQYGRLTSTLLREMKRYDLLYAIGNYSESLREFRVRLGITSPDTVECISSEEAHSQIDTTEANNYLRDLVFG